MSNDELAVGLRTWSARVAADTAELLRLLGEFDARAAWASSETAPPYAEPYSYEPPPYPRLTPRVGLFDPRPPSEELALAEYWEENERRRAKQFAARAWADHVEKQAASQEVPSSRATLADGLVRALTKPDGLPPVTVKVLLDPLSGWGRTASGELLPPMTLKQVLKALPGRAGQRLQVLPHIRHDLGRRSRTVSPALRELLGQIDGERCRFPSCTRTACLHAHHVRFWRDGGLTDLANLVLVCSRHHTLIHTDGFQLVLSPDRTLTVRDRHDIPVPHHPVRPVEAPSTRDVAPFTSGWQGDRLDVAYVVMVMANLTS